MLHTPQVTGAIHISTQKDDVKIAKITLDVTGEQKISVNYRKTKRKKGKVSSTSAVATNVPRYPGSVYWIVYKVVVFRT